MATSKNPADPRVFAPDLPSSLDAATCPELRGDHHGLEFTALPEALDASHASIVESRIATSPVRELTLRGATLTDVDIVDLQAVQVGGRNSSWRNVRVVGGRIAALDLSAASLASVELRDLRIDYLNLAAATVADVIIANCRIGTLDLPGATLTRVRFDDSSADEVDSRESRLQHVDLRGLSVARFLDVAALRGAIMTPVQTELHAQQFAAALGVSVRE